MPTEVREHCNEASREELVAQVEGIAGVLEANAAEAERRAVLPQASVDAFRKAGLLEFKVPRELGGLGAGPATEMEVYEAAAYADGSTGWTLGILSLTPALVGAFLPEAGLARVFGSGIPPAAGAVAPSGVATPSDGGFRLRGRWAFGSGIHHADWVLMGAVVEGQTPPAGIRILVVPRDEVEVHDNWQVSGLRGTGSCDYSTDDVLVPEELSFGFLDLAQGKVARGGSAFAAGLPAVVAPFHFGVALGIGRRALDEVTGQATRKGRGRPPTLLAENANFQEKLGRAAIELESARALAVETIDEAWAQVERGAAAAPPTQARIRSAACYVTEVAARVATTAFRAAGGGALHDSNPLQRCFRDAHAAAQHYVVSDSSYRAYGQFRLGRPDAEPML